MSVGESGRGPGSGGVVGLDRQLLELITELADEGMVLSLNHALHTWGRERVARVIEDGFSVARRNRDANKDRGLGDENFVPTEDARTLVNHLRKTAWEAPDAYVILDAPWAGIGPEDEPDLICRYAADDPEAVAEVRRRHAERRNRWEQNLASA